MKWLKQLVVKWVREDWNNADREQTIYSSPSAISKNSMRGGGSILDSDASLTFTVYNAIGGKVVEFRRYDRRTDHSEHSVYVVGKDEDFGQKISKIATMEVMK